MDILSKIDVTNIPKHIAIIMDGNGRWAKQRGLPRVFGHKSGVKSVKAIAEAASDIGVKFVTIYAFSTENWSRPSFEVNALMTLIVETLNVEIEGLHRNNVRLTSIGDTAGLHPKSYEGLQKAMNRTKDNTGLTLVVALNYSAKAEIMKAVKGIAQRVKDGNLLPEQINEAIFESELYTNNIPDPELLIRTSGESRISNFLLWQIAYSELYFTSAFWPDFGKQQFFEAIVDYQQRERRFGKTSEQVQ
jgi:undecaprenyl diphosphate synthase